MARLNFAGSFLVLFLIVSILMFFTLALPEAVGKGDTKAGKMTKTPDLTVTPWKHGSTLEEVDKITREGSGKMTKYERKLTDEEISAVSKYLLELTKVEP